jgi:hypothetical protein
MHESNSSATSLIILLILFNCHAVPSSHTAFVVGLTTALGMLEGTQSNLFALALVLSLVVAYDATGVRLHAGRHASVLNILIAGEPRLPLVPLVANNGCCCSAHEAMQLCNHGCCRIGSRHGREHMCLEPRLSVGGAASSGGRACGIASLAAVPACGCASLRLLNSRMASWPPSAMVRHASSGTEALLCIQYKPSLQISAILSVSALFLCALQSCRRSIPPQRQPPCRKRWATHPCR